MRKHNNKPTKKLNLITQTVRDLGAMDLTAVAGGYVDRTRAASCGGSCIRCPI